MIPLHPLPQASISSPRRLPTSASSLGPVFGHWIRGLTQSLSREKPALPREERETGLSGVLPRGIPTSQPCHGPRKPVWVGCGCWSCWRCLICKRAGELLGCPRQQGKASSGGCFLCLSVSSFLSTIYLPCH